MAEAPAHALTKLESLTPNTQLLVGGDRLLTVSEELARAFRPGDSLLVVEKTGEVLHLPHTESETARAAVTRAAEAFVAMRQIDDDAIRAFFGRFADHLADEGIWSAIARENELDVERAKARGRSTTRLVASEKMRALMIEGLRGWVDVPSMRGRVLETVDHGSWRAELVGAELGVVAFVFEGRPNVVADAAGVLRGGNTVVFRIGRDALGTARAIVELAARPALVESGLPPGAISLVDSASHAAGWALFRDRRLALAVARGSGPAVDTLGSLAQSSGVPVSLHGTGGAWLFTAASTSVAALEQNVFDSLDRKVCNTMNTCCVLRSRADELVPALLRGLERAAERRGHPFKLHVERGSENAFPRELFEREVPIGRAEGAVRERQAEVLEPRRLGHEWEWEDSPEVTCVLVEDLAQAVALFNAQSPHFVATLLTSDEAERERFYRSVDAPFVGDGFTRWVDGQYALRKPELGLSNWENGRLFGRAGILTGESVFTVRTRVSGTSLGKPR